MAKNSKPAPRQNASRQGSSRPPAKRRPAYAAVAAAAAADQLTPAQWISWGAILALIFIVPIAMTNLSFGGAHTGPITYDQFDTIKVYFQRIFIIIALVAWVWHMLTKGGKVRWTPVEWLILAFLAWVAISSIVSISPATAVFGKYRRYEGLFSFINYALVLFLVLQFSDRAKRVRQLAVTFFLSSIVVNGYGVLQFLGKDPFTWGPLPFEPNRAFSTYGNPDLLGPFVVMSISIALGLAFSSTVTWKRAVYWAGAFLGIWCWIVAFTRGAWIGGAVALAVFAFGIWRQRAKWEVVDWVAVGLVIIMVISIGAWSVRSPYAVENVFNRVKSIGQLGEGSAQTRFQIWQAAEGAIKARPVFGFGADTFRLVFPMFKPYAYVAAAGYLSVADNVHNYPLQLAAGIGVIGMLLLYAIFAWVALRTARPVFARAEAPKISDRALILGFWAACVGYIVSLTFGLSITGGTVLLWAAMGVVLTPTAAVKEFEAPSWGLPVAAVTIVLGVVGLFFWTQWFWADHYYLIARINGPGQVRTQAALTAERMNPFNDMYRSEVGLAYQDEMQNYQQLAYQAQQAGQTQQAQQYYQDMMNSLTKAETAMLATIKFVPTEYDNFVFLANLYNNAGSLNPQYYQKAIDIAKQGIAVEKFGPAIRLQYARALLATNQRAEAISQLAYAVQMDPSFADGVNLLAELYKEDHQYAQALAILKTLQARGAAPAGTSDTIAAIEASAAAAK